MKYQIVKIDGKYGIRRKVWFEEDTYLDLELPSHWWRVSANWFPDCLTEDYDLVKEKFKLLTGKVEVIEST